MIGKIKFIRPCVRNQKLRVLVIVKVHGGDYCEAVLPGRELAAMLPRSLLLFGTREAPSNMLGIIGSILRRMTVGRPVVLVEEKGKIFVRFLSWHAIRFQKDYQEKKTTPAEGSRRRPRH